jgi:hypothetical protein
MGKIDRQISSRITGEDLEAHRVIGISDRAGEVV